MAVTTTAAQHPFFRRFTQLLVVLTFQHTLCSYATTADDVPVQVQLSSELSQLNENDKYCAPSCGQYNLLRILEEETGQGVAWYYDNSGAEAVDDDKSSSRRGRSSTTWDPTSPSAWEDCEKTEANYRDKLAAGDDKEEQQESKAHHDSCAFETTQKLFDQCWSAGCDPVLRSARLQHGKMKDNEDQEEEKKYMLHQSRTRYHSSSEVYPWTNWSQLAPGGWADLPKWNETIVPELQQMVFKNTQNDNMLCCHSPTTRSTEVESDDDSTARGSRTRGGETKRRGGDDEPGVFVTS
ncbi:unnamed protein product [Amoebophrya sp. A120]|nr:unnamed protein product [Amoebophrya sp. A120]|eukprot:GSA120T00017086001.1